jgi:hypothetical protein
MKYSVEDKSEHHAFSIKHNANQWYKVSLVRDEDALDILDVWELFKTKIIDGKDSSWGKIGSVLLEKLQNFRLNFTVIYILFIKFFLIPSIEKFVHLVICFFLEAVECNDDCLKRPQ